jgi:hypothetical protein
MKILFSSGLKYICLFSLVICVNLNVAFAQQQQWASQYVSWTLDNSLDVWNIDQQVWVPESNNDGFWPLQWSWRGGNGVGGYIGLQQGNDSTAQQVRFSLWKATEAKGTSCKKFGGEGIGYTCVLPVTIDTGKFYRLRLWRLQADGDGQWWGAWLIEVENGVLTEHAIGQIKVPLSFKFVDPASITNFVEYFGPAVNQCDKVPLSVIGFTPPAVNYHGKGTGVYGGYSTYKGSRRAQDNICVSGKEEKGAFVTVKPFKFGFANGVMMFLGGASKEPTLNPQSHPTPPDMPDN